MFAVALPASHALLRRGATTFSWGALAIEAADHLRHDGSWFTGMVEPQRHHFPAGERSTYSAAAVTLAEAALAGRGPLVPAGSAVGDHDRHSRCYATRCISPAGSLCCF